jgi:hypothetical protein
VAGANHDLHVLSEFGQIDDCPGEGSEDGLSDVFIKGAGGSDGDWVAEHHIEPLLIDRVLALGLDDLFLSGVSQQHILESLVGDEAGPDGVVVHALFSLIGKILGDVEVGVLGGLDQIRVYFEGEGSEVAVVHSAPVHDLLPDVLAEGLDDEVELGLGIEGLDGLVGPGLGGLVFSGVVLRVGDDPAWEGRYQV